MRISGLKPGGNIDRKHWTVQNEDRIKVHFNMNLSEFNVTSHSLLIDNDPEKNARWLTGILEYYKKN